MKKRGGDTRGDLHPNFFCNQNIQDSYNIMGRGTRIIRERNANNRAVHKFVHNCRVLCIIFIILRTQHLLTNVVECVTNFNKYVHFDPCNKRFQRLSNASADTRLLRELFPFVYNPPSRIVYLKGTSRVWF